MKNLLLFSFLSCLALTSCMANKNSMVTTEPIEDKDDMVVSNEDQGSYTLVVEGFDWGAAVSKVILSVNDSVGSVNGSDYEVMVSRSTPCAELSPGEANGKLKVLYGYASDQKGNRLTDGSHITLVIYAAPFEAMGAPIKYFPNNPNCPGNRWVDYSLNITNTATAQIWNKEEDRIIPLVDQFDLSGKYTHQDITLPYASYSPNGGNGKRPLIIWLHGGGEGGNDASIPLLANRAANYAAPEIQAYFEGAYVLVPQAPTFWMDNGSGAYTRGEVNDKYNESLMALIKDYVSRHPNIDEDRIYVGGCSNGGYMTLKLLMLHPEYFAAGFPSALAYHGKNLTDSDVSKLKDQPIWFIHSNDDPVTRADETVIPTYNKLIAAGAQNVHFTSYDHVVDITNQFGGDGFHYLGHFSWIYSHVNDCQLDYDGTPVKVDGYPVTLMGWLARQSR